MAIGGGRSLLALADDYVAADIETTGLDPTRDAILEIGAARIVGGRYRQGFSTLVRPEGRIPLFITDLTGIDRSMTYSAPTLRTALAAFRDFLGDSLLVGHNVTFDISFLHLRSVELLGRPLTNDYVDTLRLSRRIWPEEKRHSLESLVVRFGLGESEEHRALSDARQTWKCYEYMKKCVREGTVRLDIPPREE